MIELENKLELFRRMIWEEAKKESNKALIQAGESASYIIEKRKKEIEENSKESGERHVRLAIEKSNRDLARIKDENRKKLLVKREEFLSRILLDIKFKLYEFSKSQEYRLWLRASLNKLFDNTEVDRLYVLNKDKELIMEYIKEKELIKEQIKMLPLAEDELGGFIVYDQSGRIRVRHTLLSELEDNSYKIGKEMVKWLKI